MGSNTFNVGNQDCILNNVSSLEYPQIFNVCHMMHFQCGLSTLKIRSILHLQR